MFFQQYSVEGNLAFSTFTLRRRSYTTSNLLFLSKILSETTCAVFFKTFGNELHIFQNTIYFKPSKFSKQMLFYCVNYYRTNCDIDRRIEIGIVLFALSFLALCLFHILMKTCRVQNQGVYFESNIDL
jgi:hypothetical protein